MESMIQYAVFVPLGMLGICLIFIMIKLFDQCVIYCVKRARVDEKFKNDLLSYFFYYFIEMAPDVGSAAIVAAIVGGIESNTQLFALLISGGLMKHYGRRSRDLFMETVIAGGVTWEQRKQ